MNGLLTVRQGDMVVQQWRLVSGGGVDARINGTRFRFELEGMPEPTPTPTLAIESMSVLEIVDYLRERLTEELDHDESW